MTMAQPPLEAFCQLGLLYSRPVSSIGLGTDLDKEEGWDATNYVLVMNVHEYSIWLLWKKFILYIMTAEYELASDAWLGRYAVLPGMEDLDETVIFVRLADNWNALNPDTTTDLRLTRIARAPSARHRFEEPTFVSARRTEQGGICREGDYRSKGPK